MNRSHQHLLDKLSAVLREPRTVRRHQLIAPGLESGESGFEHRLQLRGTLPNATDPLLISDRLLSASFRSWTPQHPNKFGKGPLASSDLVLHNLSDGPTQKQILKYARGLLALLENG